MRGVWYTHGGALGGGIFALQRPRPYSRHCEEGDATHAASTIIYAKRASVGTAQRRDNDAARRVATSSKERENRI